MLLVFVPIQLIIS